MTKAAWRIPGSPAMLAIALIVGLPAIGNAQLFPNQQVKRQRPLCVQEPPFNAHVRRDYFGYYPTCWSRFPAGWACPCPNPEMPNASEAFRKQPRDKPTGIGEPGTEPEATDPEMPGDLPPDPKLPPMPNQGRSPFDLDNKPATPDPLDTPPAGPRNPAGPAPRPDVPAPDTAVPAPTGLLEMPKLPAPTTTTEAGDMVLPPPDEAMLASDPGTSAGSPVHANLGPLPTPRSLAPPAEGEVQSTVAPYPVKAPARKSVIGGLFNRRRR